MANIFVDTNLFFDITIRDRKKAKMLQNHNLYVSPLTYHIYYYSEKINVPDVNLNKTLKKSVTIIYI